MPSTGQSRGRIRPHERDYDEGVDIIGNGVADVDAYNEQIRETVKLAMEDSTRKDYRRRIVRMVKFIEEKHPEYAELGCRDVPAEEYTCPDKYYFGGVYKKELVYRGMDVKMILSFLVANKKKANGKLKTHVDLRKFKDAILWGAEIANERLPLPFYKEMGTFLNAYKRETAKAKKKGGVEDKSADPISTTLYRLILGWAVMGGNTFLWFWTLTQWNCMARGASVDPLGFRNFRVANDSITCKYDDSKADKEGDKLSEKNIYANPLDFRQCWWTGFGLYTALYVEQVAKSGNLFLRHGSKEGSASTRYQEQLIGIIKKKNGVVELHIRVEHANAYGLRKGSATYATSGTTCPPPISSIARRGEWSLGKVLEVYWHFAEPGDHYLGRILAGLDPSSPNFGVLPPHFTLVDPMENEDVKLAMHQMYGPILVEHPNAKALLLRGLACILFHQDEIVQIMVNNPGHEFTKLAILSDHNLLKRLKKIVTTEPTKNVLETRTGIPPHIETAIKLEEILEKCTMICEAFTSQTATLVNAIKEAIDRKAWDSGHVTGDKLLEVLSAFKKDVITEVKGELKNLQMSRNNTGMQGSNVEANEPNFFDPAGCVFTYSGRMWDVPSTFKFPTRVTLREGWYLWTHGHVVSTNGHEKVKPFRKINQQRLPSKKLKNIYKVNWKPLFNFLEQCPDLNLPVDTRAMTQNDINNSFDKLISFLKSRVSYCFEAKDPLKWMISTWSVKVNRSSIEKFGKPEDISKLPEATSRNSARSANLKRKRKHSEHVLYPRRQERRIA